MIHIFWGMVIPGHSTPDGWQLVGIISHQWEPINSITRSARRNVILGVEPLEAVGYRYRTAEAKPLLWKL
jgi:hypothetical protein